MGSRWSLGAELEHNDVVLQGRAAVFLGRLPPVQNPFLDLIMPACYSKGYGGSYGCVRL